MKWLAGTLPPPYVGTECCAAVRVFGSDGIIALWGRYCKLEYVGINCPTVGCKE